MDPSRKQAAVVVVVCMLALSTVALAGDETISLAYRFGQGSSMRYRLGYSQQAHFSFTDTEMPAGDQQISFEGVLEFRSGPQASSPELVLSGVKARHAEGGRMWTAPPVDFEGISVRLEFEPATGFGVAVTNECTAEKAEGPLEEFAGAVGRLLPLLFPRFGPEKVERGREWESEIRLRPLDEGHPRGGVELVLGVKYRFVGMARCSAVRCARIEADIRLSSGKSRSKALAAVLHGIGKGSYLFDTKAGALERANVEYELKGRLQSKLDSTRLASDLVLKTSIEFSRLR